MIILFGLGNPGDKYIKTRHNIGFEILEYLKDEWNGEDFKNEKKFFSEISKARVNDTDVLLVKPQTFMNESGKAIKAIKNFYKIENKDIWVLHDDLDIEVSKFKIQTKRGDAGNNGIKSINQYLKNNYYFRWRIGIASTDTSFFGKLKRNFVLNKFTKKDEDSLKSIFPKIKNSLERALEKSPEDAMNKYN